jgi:hypothetical protein
MQTMSDEIPEEEVVTVPEEIEVRPPTERKNRPHLGYMCSKDFLWEGEEKKIEE